MCIYNDYRNIKSYLGVPHTTDTSLVLKATFISISQFFKSTKYNYVVYQLLNEAEYDTNY